MLSHATHFLQANDKSFNKIFKVNIDAELTKFASCDMNVEDHDVAYICANSLAPLNIRKAIISSYKQVGIHPFDHDVVLKTVQKYHIAAQSQERKEASSGWKILYQILRISNLLIGGDDCFSNIQWSQGICTNIGNIMVFNIHVMRSKLCELSINVHFEDFVERLIVCLQEVHHVGKHTNDYDS